MDWPRIDPGFGGYSLAADRQNRFPLYGKILESDFKDQPGNAVWVIIIMFGVILILFWVIMMMFRVIL
jgi:hypothetical protein